MSRISLIHSDVSPPSPNHEPGPPILGDVIGVVKAAFKQVVNISKDDSVREVFEQVVEESAPPKDILGLSPARVDATKDATGDVLAAVVCEHEKEEAGGPTTADFMLATFEPMLAQTVGEAVDVEQVGLVEEPAEKPVELVKNLVQEPKQVAAESAKRAEQSFEEPIIKPVELIQKPTEESVKESGELVMELLEQDPKVDLRGEPEDWSPSQWNESPVHVELLTHSAENGEKQGKGGEEQAGVDERKQKQKNTTGETASSSQKQETLEIARVGETNGEKEEVEDSKGKADRELQKGESDVKMPEMVQRPGQDQELSLATEVSPEGASMLTTGVEKDGEEGEKKAAFVGVLIGSETEGEQVEGETAAGGEDEIETLIQNTPVVQKTPNEQGLYSTFHLHGKCLFHATLEVILATESPAIVVDINGREWEIPQASNTMDDVMHETNIMNDITSREPVLGHVKPIWDPLRLGDMPKALPPFPTLGLEHKDTNELVEEPPGSTQSSASGQEAWKTGVIAAAFFLLLQIVVTAVYILKCKRTPNRLLCVNVCVGSGAVPEKACEEGRGGVKYDVANADTTIPAEEPITMADLMEESQVQQETVTMTTLQTDTAAKNS
ncbi:hypothetical protein P4O66_012521 [Electrophorus voltai]|uniref:Uncharacterized protein n=1 Tax=Electrophorus voltai TaxID=2609070 RepID=A0AAD8Z3S2_9TELE|nr:hypothetical protein P4O66_012521 [Electrophorus voltai]